MPYSSGTFSRVHDFTDDRDNGIRIQASRMDAEMDGIATGLSTALLKDGTQTATAKIPFAVGLSVIDNQTILLGTNSDIAIQYDESTNDSLEIAANVEGAALNVVLKADQGDDNADQHKLSIADGGTLTLGSKISGSFVSYLTHTPNSTVASSTLAVAGNLTVGGNLTLGSGAELSEAELEMLDGLTGGTVTASKAVVVDANKDIASFRNITLTGELDAGSLDVSGDADIDGTLEADAITVGGTSLATVIAGTTVTTATNATHVSVADNESTNEENLIPFIEDASATGNVGLESDGDFAYNPSTGTVSATIFKGNIDAVDGDFDGTLEADAMTLNGTAITATATLDTGISNNNVPKFTSGVADDDFLRIDGTSVEGRSASEVLSDIGASAVAGSSSIVTTGALNSGSITSGFGTIDTGSSAITTTGVGTFGSLDISGDIDVDGTTNLDVVDIDGAVDMASTLTVATSVKTPLIEFTDGDDALTITDGGNVAVGGTLTANAGVIVDNITIDGTEIDLSSGDLTVDVAGTITLNADGGSVNLADASTTYAELVNSSNDFIVKSSQNGADIIFKGVQSSSLIEAMRIDMSAGGKLQMGAQNEGFISVTHNNQSDVLMLLRDTSGSGGTAIRFRVGTSEVGTIANSSSGTAFNTSSDYRLKESINYDFDATSRLKQLKPCRFNFIADESNTLIDGFLAHEVSHDADGNPLVPEAITGEKDAMQVETRYSEDDKETQGDNPTKKVGDAKTYSKTEIAPQGIDLSKIVPLLVKTIQELEARITALESA